MKLTNVAKSLESLNLQREYHAQQETIIKMKANSYEKHLKNAACDQKKVNSKESLDQPQRECHTHCLQVEIYRTMEEADSLLQVLLKKGSVDAEVLGNKENNLPENTVTVPEQEPVGKLEPIGWKPCMSGSRLPKDDHAVIEELRVVNEQLRSQIVHLLEDLEYCHKENDQLRRKIVRLEGQLGKYPVAGRGSTNSHLPMCDVFSDCMLQRKGGEANPVGPASCLRVTTESSPGCSPFVLSPCSELSPDGGRQLPALAPLEMPTFDFPGLLPKQTSEEL
ncbi:uncharacterized protein LOC124155841 isoform X2 [Ischnura elegans]|nr:uncharacterized protein LOC124155841 isoform X2 [Ischnura elegans]